MEFKIKLRFKTYTLKHSTYTPEDGRKQLMLAAANANYEARCEGYCNFDLVNFANWGLSDTKQQDWEDVNTDKLRDDYQQLLVNLKSAGFVIMQPQLVAVDPEFN